MTIENGGINSQQISLPERYEEATIGNMLPGESAYVTPWTMWFDMEGKGWMALDSTSSQNPGGTVEMGIARAEEGFIVDISALHGKTWRKQAGPSGVGANEYNASPVIALVTNPREKKIAEDYLASLR